MTSDAAVDGAPLHHETVGDGPSCLVLHGWPGTDHTYLRPGLDVLGDRLRLVYYDHRGHGPSGRPTEEPLTVEQLADDAAALATQVGDGPVLVLGHYHGAAVAQEMALRHPDRVAGLVLVSANPGELGTTESLADTLDMPLLPVEVDGLQRVPPASDDELAATMHELAVWFFPKPAEARPGETKPPTTQPEAVFARTTWSHEAALGWTLAAMLWSSVDRLGDLNVPTLVVAGRHDLFGPPQQAERITRRAPGAEAVVLERSGHLPWLDEPEAFAAAVGAWLDARGLSGGS